VVTPEDTHAAPTIEAAKAGKHILVEKPLATTREEARSMIATARQAGVFLMPGHVLRFALQYAALHQHVSSGAIGRIVSVYARRNRARDFHRHYLRSHPALVNTVHDIDQVLWLVKQPVQRVRAWHRKVQGLANPEAVWAVLEFAGSTIAVLETMWLLPDGSGMHMDDQVEVIGEHGVAHLSMLPSRVHVWGEQGVSTLDAAYAPVISDALSGALRDELAYFVTCVATHQPPTIVTAEDGYKAIDIAIAIVESATTGKDVVLGQP
jgi:UDP-N-acetylglucosamine 3-dehydrogenase